MKLDFVRPHLSIQHFPSVDIPPLAIILGVNGSGKTHLLEAIKNGNISNSITVPPMEDQVAPWRTAEHLIKLISSKEGQLRGGPEYINTPDPSSSLSNESFERKRQRALLPHAARLELVLGDGALSSLRAGTDIWRLGFEEIAALAADADLKPALQEIFSAAEQELLAFPAAGDRSDDRWEYAPRVQNIATKLGISPLAVTEFHLKLFVNWGGDQFENNIPTLFGRYRDAYLLNRLMRLRDEDEGTSNGFSNAEFIRFFGEPPWDQISSTLEAMGLPYVVKAPDLLDYTQVKLNIVKKGSGQSVDIVNLSSGEKVLLQIAISLYDYDETFAAIRRPKILLLDEMDSPLHPGMVQRWLSAVNDGIVKKHNIHCLITTHSPTTVALADEATLFEMRGGLNGLAKISKQDALNLLTFGVPTLSIDYSGRRQVFAESDTDAAIYEKVYSLIKSKINCPRELNFLSTGMRKKDGGEINSGCTIVKGIVNDLNEGGNLNVYGVVDWDGATSSTDRVRVISENCHDGIENVLLDPLLVCLLLLKHRQAPSAVSDISRFTGITNLAPPELQRLADCIQNEILPYDTSDFVEIIYLGGKSIKVRRNYLTMDDHALETSLQEKFLALRKWLNRGALVKTVIDDVLTEYPELCPLPLKVLFEEISNA